MGTWIDTLDTAKVADAVSKLRTTDRAHAESVSVNPDTDGEFALWMVLADKRFSKSFGLGILDMPDTEWRLMFNEGLSPVAALKDAIEEWKDNGDMPGID